jgi:hypothetical protein
LPITLLPIAGKTVRALVYQAEDPINMGLGWTVYFVLPMAAAAAYAIWSAYKAKGGDAQPTFIRNALFFTTWIYFGLNYAFFNFPWPWCEWTGRTANGLIFTVCAFGLTAMILATGRGKKRVRAGGVCW